MIPLLAADWTKMRYRWMPRILILILLAIVALVFFGISTRPRFRPSLVFPDGMAIALIFAASFAAFIWPVLAGSWAGNEYGWGTVRLVLTRRPNRMQFSLAGLVMVLLVVGLGVLLALVVGAVGSALVSNTAHASLPPVSDAGAIIVKMFFAVWYTSAFYAVLAYTAGVIFRSSPAGIGLGIGFAVAQSAVTAIFQALGDPWKAVAQHFPDSYTTGLTSHLANELGTSGPFSRGQPGAPSITTSIIALAIYLAILLALMLIAVQRRDVDVAGQ